VRGHARPRSRSRPRRRAADAGSPRAVRPLPRGSAGSSRRGPAGAPACPRRHGSRRGRARGRPRGRAAAARSSRPSTRRRRPPATRPPLRPGAPSRPWFHRASTGAARSARDRRGPRAAAPTSARPAGTRAGARPSLRFDELSLRGDRRPGAEALEPFADSGERLEIDAEPVAGAKDPGHVADVGEPVVAAAEKRLRLERPVELGQALVEPRLPAAAESVVLVPEPVEALEHEPPERPLGWVGGPQGRLGEALLEVLHDHLGLGQEEAALLFVDRHPAQRVLLVEPGWPVVEVDLDSVVVEALLGEDDPRPRGVRAALGGVERGHEVEPTPDRRPPGPSPRRAAPGGPARAAARRAKPPFERPRAPARALLR